MLQICQTNKYQIVVNEEIYATKKHSGDKLKEYWKVPSLMYIFEPYVFSNAFCWYSFLIKFPIKLAPRSGVKFEWDSI